MGQQYWRLFRHNLDTIITANAAAEVIPCVETIAEEVMRQQQREQIGTCVSRDHWRLHDNEAYMVKDVGLAYETSEDKGESHLLSHLQELRRRTTTNGGDIKVRTQTVRLAEIHLEALRWKGL